MGRLDVRRRRQRRAPPRRPQVRERERERRVSVYEEAPGFRPGPRALKWVRERQCPWDESTPRSAEQGCYVEPDARGYAQAPTWVHPLVVLSNYIRPRGKFNSAAWQIAGDYF